MTRETAFVRYDRCRILKIRYKLRICHSSDKNRSFWDPPHPRPRKVNHDTAFRSPWVRSHANNVFWLALFYTFFPLRELLASHTLPRIVLPDKNAPRKTLASSVCGWCCSLQSF